MDEGLRRDELLRAVTEIALEVQRARVLGDALDIAGEGLERLGFDVAIVGVERGTMVMRYVTPRAPLLALREAVGNERAIPRDSSLQRMVEQKRSVFLEHFQEAVRRWLGGYGTISPAVRDAQDDVRRRAVLTPLNVRNEVWGAILLMHDDLSNEHLGVLNLFALQLGSAIEVAESFQDLERRNAELNLVDELGRAGRAMDTAVLCRRALETICRSTGSNAGLFYRFDPKQSEFVLVGEPFGLHGMAIDRLRQFKHEEPTGASRAIDFPEAEARRLKAELRVLGMEHVSVLPISIEGRSRGILTVVRRAGAPFTPTDVRTAEILGVQMASLVERARLYEEANQLYSELKSSYDELARTQAELVRHERLAALGELAAVVAHEVRNPLGVIFNSVTSLRRLLNLEGDGLMVLNMIQEEADRLNRIVGSLLDFVRPYEVNKKLVAIDAILARAIDSVLQSAILAGVEISSEFEALLPPIPVDAHTMNQVLSNLILNAVQAMPKGGRIFVRVFVERVEIPRFMCIEIEDEGVGLDPVKAEKIFQPFFTTKATGTGLGLAVVRRIIEAHHGQVSARPNPVRGTTFSIRLPLESAAVKSTLYRALPPPAA
jgi:signal transduction histidine kinase